MNEAWKTARLRFAGGGPLFGSMHEDPRCEASLMPEGGRAVSVLSAGDVAFALVKSGASAVIAADPSAAQHEWVKLKLALATQGFGVDDVKNWTVAEAHQRLPHAERNHRAWHRRPVLAAGAVDARLAWLARWIKPWVLGQPESVADWQRAIQSRRWRLAWSALSLGVKAVFPVWYRRHLPNDFVARLRCRFEVTCTRPEAMNNPLLSRMLRGTPGENAEAWTDTWPCLGMNHEPVLHQHLGTVEDPPLPAAVDLFALSNILDTQPAAALAPLLEKLHAAARVGATVVLRSLFRETDEWPQPPAGWVLDRELTRQLQATDRSPLCQVSAVYRCSNQPAGTSGAITAPSFQPSV
jgi:hypothetical protein